MKTHLYALPVTGIEHEVAHLFEHMLLRKLDATLRQAGYNPAAEAFWKGETYADIIFIDFRTYNSAAGELFTAFMEGQHKINLADIDIELRRIEIEERALLEIRDRKALISQLQSLDASTDWDDVASSASPSRLVTHDRLADDGSVVRKQKSARSFRDLSAGFGAQKLSADELALFGVISPVILDTLYAELNSNGLYIYGNAAPHRLFKKDQPVPHGISYIIFGVKRNTLSNHEIQKIIEESYESLVANYDIQKIRTRIKHIVKDPDFAGRTLNHLGIYVSPAYAESLVTKENIDSLLGKIELLVRPTSDGDWDRV